MNKSNSCRALLSGDNSIVATQALALHLVAPGTPDRSRLESLVAERFAREYGARIHHFLPYLVSLEIAGQPAAIAGLRLARQSSLYLEQYLDRPVEQSVSNEFRVPVDRAAIAEIGNLAASAPGSAAILFSLLPAMLLASGIRWVACTATPRVVNILGKLEFASQRICRADPVALRDDVTDWGSYYATRPVVIAGDAVPAATLAAARPHISRLQRVLEPSISRIAAVLQAAA